MAPLGWQSPEPVGTDVLKASRGEVATIETPDEREFNCQFFPLSPTSVFLNGHTILMKPKCSVGRLRFLPIDVCADDYGDNHAADDQVRVLSRDGGSIVKSAVAVYGTLADLWPSQVVFHAKFRIRFPSRYELASRR